jgi:hypothetical protein
MSSVLIEPSPPHHQTTGRISVDNKASALNDNRDLLFDSVVTSRVVTYPVFLDVHLVNLYVCPPGSQHAAMWGLWWSNLAGEMAGPSQVFLQVSNFNTFAIYLSLPLFIHYMVY